MFVVSFFIYKLSLFNKSPFNPPAGSETIQNHKIRNKTIWLVEMIRFSVLYNIGKHFCMVEHSCCLITSVNWVQNRIIFPVMLFSEYYSNWSRQSSHWWTTQMYRLHLTTDLGCPVGHWWFGMHYSESGFVYSPESHTLLLYFTAFAHSANGCDSYRHHCLKSRFFITLSNFSAVLCLLKWNKNTL